MALSLTLALQTLHQSRRWAYPARTHARALPHALPMHSIPMTHSLTTLTHGEDSVSPYASTRARTRTHARTGTGTPTHSLTLPANLPPRQHALPYARAYTHAPPLPPPPLLTLQDSPAHCDPQGARAVKQRISWSVAHALATHSLTHPLSMTPSCLHPRRDSASRSVTHTLHPLPG